MKTYAFTDADGNVEVLVDCPQEQIDIQPHNEQFPFRFDVTGQVSGWGETDLLCINLLTGQIAKKPAPPARPPTNVELIAELRKKRNDLLLASDWTQVPDAPVDRAAWAAYRQALRDLPSSTTDPRNPIWPEPPTSDKIAPKHEVNT